MEIEIPIGTKLIINGINCEISEGRKCSICILQNQIKYNNVFIKCGTKHNGNVSHFSCSKETRTDKKDIIFLEIKKS
jgi:hypothetical protein